jgi:hypothetical protein
MRESELYDTIEEMQNENLEIMKEAVRKIFANIERTMADGKLEDKLYALIANYDIAALHYLRGVEGLSQFEARKLIQTMISDWEEANTKFIAKVS